MDLDHRDYALQAFAEFLKTHHFPAGAKLVDVGCRDFQMKERLEALGFEWNGTDKFPDPSCPGIIVTAMEDMRVIPSDTYDVVFPCHSFEHCERPVDALRECRRILKPGGYLFLATPFPCKHHILDADWDHIFVLTPMQMIRLLAYTQFGSIGSIVWPGDIEQNQTVCSWGAK